MAYARKRRPTGIICLPEFDAYGRTSIPGVRNQIGERRLRRWSKARNSFFHRTKNGINDPITYFHLVEELANIKPWSAFTSGELTKHLNETRPQLVWDPIVVGRVLNDLVDCWLEANPGAEHQPLRITRTWMGRLYETTDYQPARVVLTNTIDDLAEVGEKVLDEERTGEPVKRLESPLARLASLLDREGRANPKLIAA